MKFVLLIYRTAPPDLPLPAGVERGALAAHRALQKETALAGELAAVARLADAPAARTVSKSGSSHDVSDGPYAETKEWLVGFYLVECASEAVAIARAKVICSDDSHVVEVRPATWTRT